MAQKAKYVKFNSNGKGAWIFTNPSEPIHGAILNPDLSKVKSLSPSFWKLDNGHIVAMSKEERVEVSSHTENALPKKEIIVTKIVHHKLYLVLAGAAFILQIINLLRNLHV